MAINLSIDRQKLNTTLAYPFDIISGTVEEDGQVLRLPVKLQNLTADPYTVAVDYANGSADLTFVNSTGNPITDYIRPGDVISGDAVAFPASTEYVTAVTEDASNNVTVTVNANTAQAGTGVNITFTPQPVNATVYIVELTFSTTGSNLRVSPKIYTLDGSVVEDGDQNGDDDAVVGNGTVTNLSPSVVTVNIDTFLEEARIDRTNS
jgi:hypothetical protein